MAATSEREERELLSRHETVAVYRGIEMGSEDLRRSFPPQKT